MVRRRARITVFGFGIGRFLVVIGSGPTTSLLSVVATNHFRVQYN
jgi:hypothetical protein